MSRVSKINGVLVTDTFVTGFTYNDANLLTISQNGQNDLSVGINYFSGLTITGDVSTYTLSSDTIYITSALTNNNSNTQLLTRNTSTGKIEYRDSSSISGGVSGDYLPLSGGTVTGETVFTSGITANTISATTYYNLPKDVFVTGGTYSDSSSTIIFTNTTGGTFDVSGITTFTGGTISGSTNFTSGLTANTISATSLTVDYIDFNKLPLTAYTHVEGRVHWNNDIKSLEIDTENPEVQLEVGHELVLRVVNKTGAPIPKGRAVYIDGEQGQRPTIRLASFTADTTSASVVGLTMAQINNNQNGYVILSGLLVGSVSEPLDTNSYSAGTPLYLLTGGTLTDIKPQAPDHDVRIGKVVVSNSTTGSIYVQVQNGYELDELHDVRITNKTFGDIITLSAYNGNDVWVNSKTLNGSYTITGNTVINQGLSANTISGGTISGSGTGLINIPISGVTNLPDSLNNKFDKTGGTVSGSVVVTGNVTILGTATTINTDTLSIKDNLITLNSNLTGATDQPFFGKSGIEILRGSATTTTLLWDESNLKWYAGLSGDTKQILLSGDSLSLLNSGHTHPISEINGLQSSLNDKFDKSGGTINGDLTVTGNTSLQSFTAGTGTINGNLLVTGTSSASTVTITSTPNFNNDNTQILTRNSTNGNIEYSDSSSANIFNYGLANAMVNLNFLT